MEREQSPVKIAGSGREYRIVLPFTTVLAILGTVLFVTCIKILAPFLLNLVIATVLAVALNPLVEWLKRRRLPRWAAVALIAFLLAVIVVGTIAFIGPQLYEEMAAFIHGLPKFKEQILAMFPDSNPVRHFLDQNLSRKNLEPKIADVLTLVAAGGVAVTGLTDVLLIFVFTIYVLADGPRVVAWISAYFSPATKLKIEETTGEVSKIISAYMTGQFVTSILSFIYVAIALSLLKVPSALLLAFLAGLFDILPVLGFFLAVIPALLFAMTVSSTTALAVFALYVLYHALENYFIAPKLYGSRLKVSGIVVLVSLICAGLLAGVGGAIIALPIVASYPIIERIWLKRLVGAGTIAEHRREEN